MRIVGGLGMALAMAAAQPAMAASMVGADDPAALAKALQGAGYGATLGADDLGDPVLDLDLKGYKARLLFLDCDEKGHDHCRSLQFTAAFDAQGTSFGAGEASRFMSRYRYAAVTLGESGDPTLRWDVETGDGIPRDVLLAAADRFYGTVAAMAATLYPKTAGQ